MAYDVMQVSQHIINYSIRADRPITNLKLQKLLYYIQAAFLVQYDETCFDEKIEHWRHGPVVPKVYSKFRAYIDNEINVTQEESKDICIDAKGNFVVNTIVYNEDDFYIEDIALMNNIIDSYINTNAWDMVDKTHGEDPWINTEPNEEITIESIKSYFLNNRDRIYGGN